MISHAAYSPATPPPLSAGLSAEHISKVYGTGETTVQALDDVSLQVLPGESLSVMGPSGSGKSTLLHCLAGILPPSSGHISIDGLRYAGLSDARRSGLRRQRFGFVFQDGHLLPELSALENTIVPLLMNQVARAQAVNIATQWLQRLGLAQMMDRRPGQLSGGQAQRVAIARALVTSPAVVFADEPTGALDQATGADVMVTLVRATAATRAALVVVTHDMSVASHCRRHVEMLDGRIHREVRR